MGQFLFGRHFFIFDASRDLAGGWNMIALGREISSGLLPELRAGDAKFIGVIFP
jgi:hypothetical protein